MHENFVEIKMFFCAEYQRTTYDPDEMLLIDVYNVLHTTGVLPPDLAGIDVQELAKLLLASRYGRLEIILVCDGTGGGAIDHGIDRYRQTGGSGVVRKSGGSGGRGALAGETGIAAGGRAPWCTPGGGWRPTRSSTS